MPSAGARTGTAAWKSDAWPSGLSRILAAGNTPPGCRAKRETIMRYRTPIWGSLATILAFVLSAVTLSGHYSLTVNKDRLINSANESQNWLLMNGDYGSQRYSRLTQINRDNAKDMRLLLAAPLRGHARGSTKRTANE